MTEKFVKDGLYFIALGGADEIGMNMYVYAANGKFIMVDAEHEEIIIHPAIFIHNGGFVNG